MSTIVESREYVDGDKRIVAEIGDDGIVRIGVLKIVDGEWCGTYGGLGYLVLEQLADLARKAQAPSSTM